MAVRKIRPIRVDGNDAYVPLSRGLEAIIDAADLGAVQCSNWCAVKSHNTFYAYRFFRNRDPDVHISLGRLLLDAPKNRLVDHIDGDGLNNKRSNLRLATVAENLQNRRQRRDAASRFKGVSFSSSRLQWQAEISYGGKTIFLGRFDREEDAYAAYCEAAKKHHGEFARIT